MRSIKLLVAAFALSLGGQAQAAKLYTLSGTVSPYDLRYYTFGFFAQRADLGTFGAPSFVPDWNKYRVSGMHITFAEPVTGAFGAGADGQYYAYLRGGEVFDSNDTDISFYTPFTNATSAKGVAALPSDCSHGSPICTQYTWFTGGFGVTLDPISHPVNFKVNVFGAVPEPSTWALMILGFGGIGAAMRGRRKAVRATVAC